MTRALGLIALAALSGCFDFSAFQLADLSGGELDMGNCPIPAGTNLLVGADSSFDGTPVWYAPNVTPYGSGVPGCVGRAWHVCPMPPGRTTFLFAQRPVTAGVSFERSTTGGLWVNAPAANVASVNVQYLGSPGTALSEASSTGNSAAGVWTRLMAQASAPAADMGAFEVVLTVIITSPGTCIDVDQAWVMQP
jgi:hypothetical protein